ncbi:tyrosine-type recombinase/integrase [Paraburkholderia tropica]|uniref:tyrosine-type recombinase/integrase n=1 Tax=Paraburkholderia tropica TaxID=92647 RepID=UPI00161C3F15|nr:tyrosine-type recombinase/integrase [Paraburkholderia tropica]MBB2984788.1 integrase [Paraburkholderia tropica]
MSAIREALVDYVAMRRGFGLKFNHQENRLTEFVRFMEEHDATIVTSRLALEWATQLGAHRPTSALRLADIRGFARYLSASEPNTEVLPTDLIRWPRRKRPYLYDEEEIRRLMAAALKLRPANGLRRWTFHCLFGVLAVTGMRIGEALALHRDDVDLDDGILIVRETKFGKSRLVPVHSTTQASMALYAEQRDAHVFPPHSPYFFVAEHGAKLWHQNVCSVFVSLAREIGLRDDTGTRNPRLHDFRHTFAVRALLTWYREGTDVNLMMPVLSTYLGHSCVRDTYWYLSECPELMQHAALKLEQRWGVR